MISSEKRQNSERTCLDANVKPKLSETSITSDRVLIEIRLPAREWAVEKSCY